MTTYPHVPGVKSPLDTAHAAAARVAPVAGTLRARVLAVIAERPSTADECAVALGASVLGVRPRLSELHRLGQIADSGQRRRNDSGVSAVVWRLTAAQKELSL